MRPYGWRMLPFVAGVPGLVAYPGWSRLSPFANPCAFILKRARMNSVLRHRLKVKHSVHHGPDSVSVAARAAAC